MIKGKVAIVTGASSGIGYVTALTLAKAGAKVAIGARRTDKLSELENKIQKDGGEAFSQKLDVTQKSECNSFVEAVLWLGQVGNRAAVDQDVLGAFRKAVHG